MSTQIVVEIPDSAEMGRLIGKNGLKKKKLEEDIRFIIRGFRADLVEMELVMETRPKNLVNSIKLRLSSDISDEIVLRLKVLLETTIVQSCSIPQSQLHSKISTIESDKETFSDKPHNSGAPGEGCCISEMHKSGRLPAINNPSPKYLDALAHKHGIDLTVLEEICDKLGISALNDFALLTDIILVENIFVKELSWLKALDKIKLQKLCQSQRAQLEHGESEKEIEEQEPKIFSSFCSHSGRLLLNDAANYGLSTNFWRPFASGPAIFVQNERLVDSDGGLRVIVTRKATTSLGRGRNLEEDESGSRPHENCIYALVPQLGSKDQSSLLDETVRLHVNRAFDLALAWNYTSILFETSLELVSEWNAQGRDRLVARAYLQEAVLLCKRLAFSSNPPALSKITVLDTEAGGWKALREELDGMLRVARGQSLFAEATFSTPLGLDPEPAARGSDLMPAADSQVGAGAAGRDARSCYDATSVALRESDELGFKAGGLMFVRVNAGRVEVLLCVERRPLEGTVVMALGGQRDPNETEPHQTAVREFCEETAGLLPRHRVLSAVRHTTTRKLWVGFGKYLLYVASAAGMRDVLDRLPEQYERLHFKPFSSEADHLVWVPWNRVCAAVSSCSPKQIPRVQVRVGSRSGASLLAVGSFLQRLSAVPLVAEAINAVGRIATLDKTDLVNKLMDEIDKTQELLKKSDESMSRELLGDAWKLKLQAPPLPQCTIFNQLAATSESYQRFKATLPPEFAQRVVGIRSIHLACRQAEFLEARSKLTKEAKEIKDMEPLFHGTPERWRATAIATHGFNTTIVLNGRALGNGVYTSANPQICQGYTRTGGSILWLKGLVTKDHTRENPPVYVFSDPKHVLPQFIADLSATDVSEQQVCQEAEKLRSKIIRQHEEEKKEFESKENEFRQEVIGRWRRSAHIYMESLEHSLQFATETPADTAAAAAASSKLMESADDESTFPSRSWSNELMRIDREAFQFNARLPIYVYKRQIIDAVQKHHVTILTADTGSGKSTQLPQYLLDHVLPDSKSRIAVLQPRRVNAVSLAARVSSERNGEVGGEVGYRLGRGEASVSDETRVEFMTHGLFVQIAHDASRLLRSYSAVILDEAHERSVDIDLSLGLLRNALVQNLGQGTGSTPFKVVVMSATISQEQIQTFLRHLTPVSDITCAALDLPGHTFPVRTVYRSDLQPDPAVIGSGAVGSILGDYATELALDLLQKTSSGHILVFMPGESSIERAMRSSMLLMSKRTTVSESSAKAAKKWWDVFQVWNSAINDPGADTAEKDYVQWNSGGFVLSLVTDEKESSAAGDSGKPGRENSERRRLVRVGFYPFHGRLTGIERDRVLKPRDDRLVVFATNVAETGLTIPDVRYVIDTGLERRVMFEAATGLSKMVTVPISQSSMHQRAGRAGRVASGVCIRLYSAETAQAFSKSDPLEVEGTPVLSTALKLVSLGSSVVLPDPINPEQLQAAKNALKVLGAVDADGKLTAEVGQPLLKLGLDLRLGRFLLACDKVGCVEHGVRLAAIIATDAHQRLLPVRSTTENQAHAVQRRFGGMLDQSGDHLTLVRIMIKYEKAAQKIEWCKSHGFDYASLNEAQRAKVYLLEVLAHLRLRLQNDTEKITASGGWERAVLRCLCAGYCDQLAVARKPGDCKEGFVRLLDEESKATAVSSIDQFSLNHGKQRDAGDLGISLPDPQLGQQVSSSGPGPRPATNGGDVKIRLGNTSSLWTLCFSKSAEGPILQKRSLVVFSSVMLTDARPDVPQANMMSYVTAEDVQEGAPSWCREAGFGKLYDSTVRHTVEYPLPPNASSKLLKNYGSCLAQLRQRFPAIWLNFDKKENLIKFSAPEGIIVLVKENLDKLVSDMISEFVEISVPSQADMAKFIGKGGKQKNELEKELKTLAKQAGADPESLSLSVETVPAKPRNVVRLHIEGSVKAIAGALIGRIQSSLIESCKIPVPQLCLGNTNGAVSASLQANPRLMQLSTSTLAPQWIGRDGAMLQLAHAIIWQCKCSVYGGFVRDWVVRGQSAVDIDVLVQPGKTEETAAALRSRAALIGLACSGWRTKGASRSLTFSDARLGSPIDVDLVDPATVPFISPGVDADIDNICISAQGVLGLKVPGAAGSSLPLAKCVKHAQRGKFVFLYQLDAPSSDIAVSRLRKLLTKNFICLSPVPPAVISNMRLTPEQQRLLQPKLKYSLQWWAGAQ